MADDHKSDQESVQGTIMGNQFKIRGIGAVVVIVLAGALLATGYLLIEFMKQASKEHEAIVEAVVGVGKVNESIGRLIDEQNFIVLSDERDRQEIKKQIRMPDSLRKKLDR